MKHLFSTRVRVVLILVLLLAVALSVVSGLTGINVPDMLVQGVLTPIRSGVSKLADKAEQLYSYIFNYETLLAENEALKARIAELEENQRYADSVARENERLKALLELSNNREDFAYVDGYIAEGDFAGNGEMKLFPVAKSTEVLVLNETDWNSFAQETGASKESLATMEGLVDTAKRYYEWSDGKTPEIANDGKAFFDWYTGPQKEE